MLHGPWETCEIRVTEAKKFIAGLPIGIVVGLEYHFEAVVIGPDRRYTVAHSETFKPEWVKTDNKVIKQTKGAEAALGSLVEKLIQNGWEPITHGQYWHSNRFQRKVEKEQGEQTHRQWENSILGHSSTRAE